MENINGCIKLGWFLFVRDFQYRYRQTYFGYAWAFVSPMLMVIPLIVVGKQFNFDEGENLGVSYEVFAFVGLMLWQVFWDAVVLPQWMMRRVRKILKKTIIQYESIIIASLFYVLFNLSVYITLVFIMLLISEVAISWTAVFVLLGIIMLILSGLTIGINIAPLTLVYLDLRYSLPIFSGILLWSAPIAYASPGQGLLHSINKWNPLTYLITIPRSCLIGSLNFNVWQFIISCIFFLLLFLLSLKFYRRTMPIVIEQIL